jgi:hypothetical protein
MFAHKRFTRMMILGTVLLMLLAGVIPAAHARPDPQAAPAADYDSSVPLVWYDLILELVETTPGFSPPVAARAFGYTGVTLYEAVVPGMPGYQTLAGQLSRFMGVPQPDPALEYHWPAVASAALEAITRDLFAGTSDENQAKIETLARRLNQRLAGEVDTDVLARSLTQGQAVAGAIYAWAQQDGASQVAQAGTAGYYPPHGAGQWEPTLGADGSPVAALLPDWGTIRPFVLPSGAACAISAPPGYAEHPESPFYREAREVYDAGQNLTAEQRAIAAFWADNPGSTPTPPGHWIALLTQLLREDNHTLDVAAEAYAKLGMAVADAFILCWHAKYQYNLVRPVTYINAVIDPDWMPLIPTPPFPEYPSGHSVQSAAAAVVLTDLFGANYAFVDHTHERRGLAPRAFDSFAQAAREAAISRLYGGIHFRAAIEVGLQQGECVGQRINGLAFRR